MKAKKQNVQMVFDGAEHGFEMPVIVHNDAIFSDRSPHLVAEKSPLKSKTLWFNLIALVLTTLATILPAFEAHMNNKVYLVIVGLVTFGNKAIRLVTRQPLARQKHEQLEHEQLWADADYFGEQHYQSDKNGDSNGR